MLNSEFNLHLQHNLAKYGLSADHVTHTPLFRLPRSLPQQLSSDPINEHDPIPSQHPAASPQSCDFMSPSSTIFSAFAHPLTAKRAAAKTKLEAEVAKTMIEVAIAKTKLKAAADQAMAVAEALATASSIEAERVVIAAEAAEADKAAALAEAAQASAIELEAAVAKARAEAESVAAAHVATCVVCHDQPANQMPFKCQHVIMCRGES